MYTDNRIVLTLDAGGTNFVFTAIRNCREIVTPITKQAVPTDLNQCLQSIVEGFEEVQSRLEEKPAAISFAFPGPADYENGIIGDLPNFPSFRGGVALGPYLQEKFRMPVFINNDGNLFAYGEATAGILPEINQALLANGNTKQYKNLIGITLGTGFGAGVVINSTLLTGDNGCGGDTWCFRNKFYPHLIAEESVSIRAVKRIYNELSGENNIYLTPKDIFDIAEGKKDGNLPAAVESFSKLGEAAGDAISHAVTLIDGIVVIGGGLTGATKYIFPALINEMKNNLATFSGLSFPRLQMQIFDLTNKDDYSAFLTGETRSVPVPETSLTVPYNCRKSTGIALSRLGTSKAIAIGAYTYALNRLDRK
ncbi:MAG: ROK family protein [Tannerellaceae bacterium]|nr:ROK family protein [Tannerellaceae bacterium]